MPCADNCPSFLKAAKREAEALHRYRIMKAHTGVMLWLWKDQWQIVQPFASREVAEDFLVAKCTQDGP